MLDRLFANELYDTGLQFKRVEGYPTKVDGCVIIIPGRYWFQRANQISESLSRFQWVLAIRTGDEEDLFQPDRVYHPNIKWWIQSPNPERDYDGARLFGVGYPPHFNALTSTPRTRKVFLSAQNTHDRRRECFDALNDIPEPKLVEETAGFTHGMGRDEYATAMCSAKVAPAPSGPETPDTFRLFEALEAHTVPVADDKTFWHRLFQDAPFPIVDNYEQLPGYINDQVDAWPANSNRITAWWMHQKRQLTTWLLDDLHDLDAAL
jgi:hypothetical protein